MSPHHHHEHHRHAGHGTGLQIALVATLAFALVEAVAGWWSGSLALLGDAGHMLTDAAALALAAGAALLARRPPTARHSFGLGRVEILAALANAGFMLGLVLAIGWNAVLRLGEPRPVAGDVVAWVAGAGLAMNLAVAWLLSRGEQTMNTRGALLHVLGDALGSVAALAAGLITHFTGWTRADPLLSLLICALILGSTLRLLRDAGHALLEGVPAGLSLAEVGREMAQVPGVVSVHDLHIWSLSSNQIALSAHVRLRDLGDWDRLLAALRELLHERYDIEHVTLQPELEPPPAYATVAVSAIGRATRH